MATLFPTFSQIWNKWFGWSQIRWINRKCSSCMITYSSKIKYPQFLSSDFGINSNILVTPHPCKIFIPKLLYIDTIPCASHFTILRTCCNNHFRQLPVLLITWRGFALSRILERTGTIRRFFLLNGLNSSFCLCRFFEGNKGQAEQTINRQSACT